MSDPFENTLPTFSVLFCTIHNQPGLYINPDPVDQQRRVLCIDCLTNHKKVEDQIKENQKIFKDIQKKNKGKIDTLNVLLLFFHEFYSRITQNINKIITLIKDQIDIITINQTKHNEIFIKSKLIEINPIIQTNETQNQQFKEFNKLILDQLKNVIQNFNLNLLIQQWQQINEFSNIKQNNKKFQYSQITNFIQQYEFCYALAINANNSNLVVGSRNNIRTFELQNEQMKEIIQISRHQHKIRCLNFMKKSQQLVSACDGGKIIIWQYNISKQLQFICSLNAHQNRVNCLQINSNEDLIISGSNDKTIKFWRYDSNQWLCVYSMEMEDWVICMSLSESNSKLIVSIRNQSQIQLIVFNGNKWHLAQTIQLSKFTPRLCFINDNQFAVQLLESAQLQIFNIDQKDGQFKLGQEIKVKYSYQDFTLFQMQYIKSIGMLVDKNCQYINILRKQQNGEFILDQSIEFGDIDLYGCVSDDGQYLFTWDKYQQKIQLRKLEMV